MRLPAILVVCALCFLATMSHAQIYVSTKGSDTNNGNIDSPKATLQAALRQAREIRRLKDTSIKNGARIMIKGGTYKLDEPIFIRPEDAGTKDSPTEIEAAPNEKVIISGGIDIKNWRRSNTSVIGLPTIAKGKIWEADVPLVGGRPFEFRQLWVNDKKAIRAKSMNGEKMNRILSWNKKEQTCWIPTPKTPSVQKVETAEMFIHQWWAIAILRIKKMEVHGDSTQLFFQQPESRIQSEHPWPAPWISKETGNSAFYLTNALQFLDEPGEWYLDIAARKVYYWPKENENLATATVTAPYLETLVKIEGTIDNAVSYVNFTNISFEHSGWLRPSQQGHVPHQAGMYMLDAYKLKVPGTPDKKGLENQAWVGRPTGAVEVSYTSNTNFTNCSFEHMASTALDFGKGVHESKAQGNLFKDIGGAAILAGLFSEESSEIHLPYNPKDEREVSSELRIENNLLTDATNEDWSSVGIGAGYVRNTIIAHNEIENVSYSAISVGWGWSPTANVMRNNRIISNKIHHYGKHNYDCAGIYTLSAQPGTLIADNYIDSIYRAPYAHLPSHWFYLYTDEGSSNMTIENNWTPTTKYLQNANGPGNTWSNNGPQVNDSVKLKAGLQAGREYLAKEKNIYLNAIPINEEHNEIIEFITKEGSQLDVNKLKQLLAANNMDSNAVYQWQNHYVVFDKIQDIGTMQGRFKNNFPEAEVKVYHDLFYNFNRKKYCKDKAVAKEWDHIILTANLVADKKLQQEYLDYHETQFEKWPEVAKGFCNADFQQLLVFKNGRQLMLVISIPKGESLDKLNPKTTENNPRVNDWNNLMKKYQEGIAGTKKGETWVFLERIKN